MRYFFSVDGISKRTIKITIFMITNSLPNELKSSANDRTIRPDITCKKPAFHIAYNTEM